MANGINWEKLHRFQKKPGWCGPAVIQMVLLAAGIKKTQKEIVKAVYTGPYEKMMPAYDKVMAYIKENKLEISGRAWEQYISDPGTTPPEKLITHIYFPVK